MRSQKEIEIKIEELINKIERMHKFYQGYTLEKFLESSRNDKNSSRYYEELQYLTRNIEEERRKVEWLLWCIGYLDKIGSSYESREEAKATYEKIQKYTDKVKKAKE